ncbi:hypothetical protein ABTQ33_04780 [Paucilactobacillus suebicus]|nr:hypothetical protein [Paucilactobacillus suebicus]
MRKIDSLNSAIDASFPLKNYTEWPIMLMNHFMLGLIDSETDVYTAFIRMTGPDKIDEYEVTIQLQSSINYYVSQDYEDYKSLFYEQFINDMTTSIKYDERVSQEEFNAKLGDEQHLPMGYTPILEAYANGYEYGFIQMMSHVTEEYMEDKNINFSPEKLHDIEMNSLDLNDDFWSLIWHSGLRRMKLLKHIFKIE